VAFEANNVVGTDRCFERLGDLSVGTADRCRAVKRLASEVIEA
jgi:hypothetical protein